MAIWKQRQLLLKGASLTNTNKYGATLLMLATFSDKLEVVRYLTEMGANIDSQQPHCPSADTDSQQQQRHCCSLYRSLL